MSIVGYDDPGIATFPMPIIWKDCPNDLLNSESKGMHFFERFMGFTPLTTTVSPGTMGQFLTFNGDTDTEVAVIDNSRYGGVRMETNTTEDDAGALVSRPFGRIVENSGNKLWFEARVAPGDVDAALGIFVGLVELDGANSELIIDTQLTNDSLDDQSYLGFFQNNGDDDAFAIVTQVAGSAGILVLADATNGTGIPSDDRASLTDGTFFRLGIRFDGIETVSFFVNGHKVATAAVSTLDQTQDMCAIVAIKTAAGAAELVDVSYIRAAFQER